MKIGDKYKVLNPEAMGIGSVYSHGDILTIVSMEDDGVGFDRHGLCIPTDWVGEYLEPVRERTMKVIYCVDDVLAAAKYVSRYNTLLNKEPEEIYKDIIRDIHWCVKKGWGSTATSGYNIIVSLIDDDTYDCSISVDPNFDTDLVYTMEEVV